MNYINIESENQKSSLIILLVLFSVHQVIDPKLFLKFNIFVNFCYKYEKDIFEILVKNCILL